MRIKKESKSVGVLGKILNLFSNSKQDTYSCDYINNFFLGKNKEIKVKSIEVGSVKVTSTDIQSVNLSYSNIKGTILAAYIVSLNNTASNVNIESWIPTIGAVGDIKPSAIYIKHRGGIGTSTAIHAVVFYID